MSSTTNLHSDTVLQFRPSPTVNQEIENIPIIPNIAPRPSPIQPINPFTPAISKATDIPDIKNDLNKENLPMKPLVPSRETLSIYRPINQPYQKQFDKTTGR